MYIGSLLNIKIYIMVMPTINYLAIIVAGLIPSIVGAIYYGPLLGKVWRDSLGKTEEELQPSNPVMIEQLPTWLDLLFIISAIYTIAVFHYTNDKPVKNTSLILLCISAL